MRVRRRRRPGEQARVDQVDPAVGRGPGIPERDLLPGLVVVLADESRERVQLGLRVRAAGRRAARGSPCPDEMTHVRQVRPSARSGSRSVLPVRADLRREARDDEGQAEADRGEIDAFMCPSFFRQPARPAERRRLVKSLELRLGFRRWGVFRSGSGNVPGFLGRERGAPVFRGLRRRFRHARGPARGPAGPRGAEGSPPARAPRHGPPAGPLEGGAAGALWPKTFVTGRSLARLAGDLRKALGDGTAAPKYIRTVHRVGYAFCAQAARSRATRASGWPFPAALGGPPDRAPRRREHPRPRAGRDGVDRRLQRVAAARADRGLRRPGDARGSREQERDVPGRGGGHAARRPLRREPAPHRHGGDDRAAVRRAGLDGVDAGFMTGARVGRRPTADRLPTTLHDNQRGSPTRSL